MSSVCDSVILSSIFLLFIIQPICMGYIFKKKELDKWVDGELVVEEKKTQK